MFRLAFHRLRVRPWLLGLLAFAGYWGLPALLAALSGTLITRDSLAGLMAALPPFVLRLGFHQALLDAQHLQSGLAYLNDRSHFAFAALLFPGGVTAALILARVHSTVATLRTDGILCDDTRTLEIYRRFRRIANHRTFRAASLLLAGATSLVFLSFHLSDGSSSARPEISVITQRRGPFSG